MACFRREEAVSDGGSDEGEGRTAVDSRHVPVYV